MAESRDTATETVGPDKQEQIAVRAYELWMERGCPLGSPEIDWYQAVAEISSSPPAVKQHRTRAA